MKFFILFSIYVFTTFISGSFSLLPQAHQDGILSPFKSFADITLFHYYLPKEVAKATFEFAAFMDRPHCQSRPVYIYLQHGSYPVFSPDNSTFPPKYHTGKVSHYSLRLMTESVTLKREPSLISVLNPLPGSWFSAAFFPNWDQHMKQDGLGHRCEYSIASIGFWTQVTEIRNIPLNTPTRLRSDEHFTYYKFYIPNGVWEFDLRIDSCTFQTSHRFPETQFLPTNSSFNSSSNSTSSIHCIKNVFLRPRALPEYKFIDNRKTFLNDTPQSFFYHEETLPYTDVYYYILIEAEAKVSYNFTINIRECPSQIVKKNFIFGTIKNSQLGNMKENAFRFVNRTLLASERMKEMKLKNCSCVPIFPLTRIKHSQDFSDTFLIEGNETFTNWIVLTDLMPIGVFFELLPYIDIGGTLTIIVHLDSGAMNLTTQTVEVSSCISTAKPSKGLCCANETSKRSCCQDGLELFVTNNISSITDQISIPFPEPETIFISFLLSCYSNGIKVECNQKEFLLSLDIKTHPCAFTSTLNSTNAIYPCGEFGYCQEVHDGQFFFTACRCLGGYRGWGCSDDTFAIAKYLMVLTTLYLTLSNLFFIPAIVLSIRRRLYTHFLVYFATMVSSGLYHACDQELYGYCIARYNVLQFCDFFCSILSFWVTLISLGNTPTKYDSFLYMLGAVLIAIGVENNRTGLMVLLIPFIFGLGIPLGVWANRSCRAGNVLVPNLNSILLFLPGIFLGGAGIILFAFIETEENYQYTHSAWHIIIALSLVYIMPKKRSETEFEISEGNLGTNGLAEFTSVNNYQSVETPGSGPVFVITSELDQLVDQETR